MRTVRLRDTGPEMALRRALHGLGLRYRVHQPIVPGARRRPDIVFPTQRVALFVDGCFWHSCPLHATASKSHAAFWRKKLAENQRRDRDTDQRLTGAGWRVVRVWEHEDVRMAARRVERVLRQVRDV